MPRRLYEDPHWALGVIVVSLVVMFAAIGYAAVSNRHQGDTVCSVLYGMIARSGATLGDPGTPGYAYYQEHPDELRAARSQNHEFLEELPCNG